MNKMLKTNNSVTSLGPSHVKLSRENKGRILKLKDNNPENNLQLRNAKTKSYDSGDNDVKQLKDLNVIFILMEHEHPLLLRLLQRIDLICSR
jgi:hypothetical protein